MERYKLEAVPRTLLGKQKVKRLRREGILPAVIYGRGMDPTPLQVSKDAFQQMLKTVGHNVLVDLTIQGNAAPLTVLVKKIQRGALGTGILNVDFHSVAATDQIINRVPVELIGEPQGVVEGGTLLQPLVDVEIRAMASDLPPSLQVDVSHLGLDESLHVRDIIPPAGVEILSPPEETVAAVHAPRAVEEEPVEPEKITEPELVIERKPKEEE